MKKISKSDALNYHEKGKPGKIEVIPTKPYSTQRDLAMAYTPGVADPCLEIEKRPEDAYKYTAKGNLVAVISNGTAVLGLGDIGALAGKPVMEGKALLFKIFGDVDVFDIEMDEKNIDKIIETVKIIAPTFGGINLEDIKAPECFEIEERLIKELNIPVFHDDQHGTAIISAAALINALEISGKDISKVKVVVNGAGAAAVSCIKLYSLLGVKKENIIMLDSKGVINTRRTDLNEIKKNFIADTNANTLEEAMVGADVFLGLSVGNVVSKKMLQSMAKDPIVFACANPTPEIPYDDAMSARDDVIFATGRSDYPNQVNNVLGFPFIFRGALDVRATTINEEMKLAASYALAELAKEPVPEVVIEAYNVSNIEFGKEYLIPKPLDPRLISKVASAVAKAAIDSGVATKPIDDWDAYEEELNTRLGLDNKILNILNSRAQKSQKRVVFTEGHHTNILKAVQQVLHDGIAKPILLGNPELINKIAKKEGLDIAEAIIIDPNDEAETERREKYMNLLYTKMQRNGFTYIEAKEKIFVHDYFAMMMVESGDADAVIAEHACRNKSILIPATKIVGTENNAVGCLYIMMTKRGTIFVADSALDVLTPSDVLSKIALHAAKWITNLNMKPVMAMISHSNFGQDLTGSANRVHDTVKYLHENHPDLLVDGELQVHFALNDELRKQNFPFTKLGDEKVNTLIMPNITSGAVAYQMVQEFGSSMTIGPVLMGLKKSIHSVRYGSSTRDIVNMVKIAVNDAIMKEKK